MCMTLPLAPAPAIARTHTCTRRLTPESSRDLPIRCRLRLVCRGVLAVGRGRRLLGVDAGCYMHLANTPAGLSHVDGRHICLSVHCPCSHRPCCCRASTASRGRSEDPPLRSSSQERDLHCVCRLGAATQAREKKAARSQSRIAYTHARNRFFPVQADHCCSGLCCCHAQPSDGPVVARTTKVLSARMIGLLEYRHGHPGGLLGCAAVHDRPSAVAASYHCRLRPIRVPRPLGTEPPNATNSREKPREIASPLAGCGAAELAGPHRGCVWRWCTDPDGWTQAHCARSGGAAVFRAQSSCFLPAVGRRKPPRPVSSPRRSLGFPSANCKCSNGFMYVEFLRGDFSITPALRLSCFCDFR